MNSKNFLHPSPEPDSPNMPVWTPSQFRAPSKSMFKGYPLETYSLGETIANAVSNGVAAALSIAALVVLIVMAVLHGGGVRVLVALVFAVPMLLAFLMSTLYHALPGETPKRVFMVLGHDFAFLYIAGAFTPYCVLLLADVGGLTLCSLEWAAAFIGVLVESIWFSRPKWLPSALCLIRVAMGLPLASTLSAVLAPAGWWLLVAAVVCFCLGIVSYLMRKVPYMWFVSHLVVLAGSVCLFLSVALFVI